jgi:uncharacterized protein
MIIDETLNLIRTRYGDRFLTTTIDKAIVGIYFTAVKLSSGYGGLAYTDLNKLGCCTDNRKKGFGDFTPGHISGQKIAGLFNHQDHSHVLSTVRLAVMNALSAELMAESDYKIIEDIDPIELIDLSGSKNICIVGAFLSYIKKIAETNNHLQIAELDINALPDEYKKYFVSADRTKEAFSGSDIIIITGASLSNNSLDELLEFIPPGARVVLVGPTSSLLPDILFGKKVHIIGSTRITDADKMLQFVSEGAAGFHLFKSCAQKICIINEARR